MLRMEYDRNVRKNIIVEIIRNKYIRNNKGMKGFVQMCYPKFEEKYNGP